MKTFILFLLLFTLALGADAQRIFNRTPCQLVVRPFCYGITTCAPVACGGAVLVPPFGNVPLPVCNCGSASLQGYAVCWGPATGCPNICTTVGDAFGPWPCAAFQSTAILGACINCTSATGFISYDAAGDMLIQ